MALGSIQPVTEMSTRNFPGVKGGRRVRLKTLRLTTLLPSVSQLSRCYRSLDVLQLCGPSRPVTRIALIFFTNHLGTYIAGKVKLSLCLSN
jgi:hypothetical protein